MLDLAIQIRIFTFYMNSLLHLTLTPEQLDILKFGFSHSIRPPSITTTDVFTCFERMNYTMSRNIKDSKLLEKLTADLSHLAHSYMASYRPSKKDLRRYKVLKELKIKNNIVILKPDKENGVVILDRDDFDKRMLDLISDRSKFSALKKDPTLSREGQLQRYLRKLHKLGRLDNNIYKEIYPTGSQPARIYGLPKMHKPRPSNGIPPFRPIMCSIDAYNYNLAKHLGRLLAPHIPSELCTQDSFTFINEIKELSPTGKFLVSIDVESLFTNIPLDESIDLAVNYIIDGNPSIKLKNSELK